MIERPRLLFTRKTKITHLKKFILLFLLLKQDLYAQLPGQQMETPFDQFIKQPGIEWAAYINDTVRFTKFNLNAHLVDRLFRHSIKASFPVGSGSPQAARVTYLKTSESKKLLFNFEDVQSFDSEGNLSLKNKTANLKSDTSGITLSDVTEILFVENGQLGSYIPWIAPMVPVVTSTGTYLGDGDWFSTCFSPRYHFVPPTSAKEIYLGNSVRKISVDSIEPGRRLKELYGRNLVQTIWPYIIKGTFKVNSPKTGKLISAADLNTELINEERKEVPVYDSLGNQMGVRFVTDPLSPLVFSMAQLKQDWYYHDATNTVYSRIRELILCAKKQSASGEARDATEILRIIIK